jgi:hypothetical protein
MFSSKFTTPTLSFAAGLRSKLEQKKRSNVHQDSEAGLIDHETSNEQNSNKKEVS